MLTIPHHPSSLSFLVFLVKVSLFTLLIFSLRVLCNFLTVPKRVSSNNIDEEMRLVIKESLMRKNLAENNLEEGITAVEDLNIKINNTENLHSKVNLFSRRALISNTDF